MPDLTDATDEEIAETLPGVSEGTDLAGAPSEKQQGESGGGAIDEGDGDDLTDESIGSDDNDDGGGGSSNKGNAGGGSGGGGKSKSTDNSKGLNIDPIKVPDRSNLADPNASGPTAVKTSITVEDQETTVEAESGETVSKADLKQRRAEALENEINLERKKDIAENRGNEKAVQKIDKALEQSRNVKQKLDEDIEKIGEIDRQKELLQRQKTRRQIEDFKEESGVDASPENLTLPGQAVVKGAEIIRESEQVGKQAAKKIPEGSQTQIKLGPTTLSGSVAAFEEAASGDAGQAVKALDPTTTTDLERKRQEQIQKGIVSGPGTFAGFIIGGAGASSKALQQELEKLPGTGETAGAEGPGVIGSIQGGSEKIASQAAKNPGKFAAQELGEEIGEGVATAGIGLAVPTITPSITPEPETEVSPDNTFIDENSEVIGTQETPESDINIPEDEQVPDLGEQAVGRDFAGGLRRPGNQIVEPADTPERVPQPGERREAGVPGEEQGLTQEEIQVLRQRRERQPGVENVESDIQELADAGTENVRATEVRFESENVPVSETFSDPDPDAETEGLQGVLGGKRKGQTSGIPLVRETEPEPDTGFDQQDTGVIEPEDTDTDLDDIVIENRQAGQDTDLDTTQTPDESLEADLADGVALGLSLDPTVGLAAGQDQDVTPFQEQPQDITEEVQQENFLEPDTETPQPDPTSTFQFQQETFLQPEPEPTPEKDTTASGRTPRGDFNFEDDRKPESGTTEQDSGEVGESFEFRSSVAGELGFGSEETTVTEEEFKERGFATGFNVRLD